MITSVQCPFLPRDQSASHCLNHSECTCSRVCTAPVLFLFLLVQFSSLRLLLWVEEGTWHIQLQVQIRKCTTGAAVEQKRMLQNLFVYSMCWTTRVWIPFAILPSYAGQNVMSFVFTKYRQCVRWTNQMCVRTCVCECVCVCVRSVILLDYKCDVYFQEKCVWCQWPCFIQPVWRTCAMSDCLLVSLDYDCGRCDITCRSVGMCDWLLWSRGMCGCL